MAYFNSSRTLQINKKKYAKSKYPSTSVNEMPMFGLEQPQFSNVKNMIRN